MNFSSLDVALVWAAMSARYISETATCCQRARCKSITKYQRSEGSKRSNMEYCLLQMKQASAHAATTLGTLALIFQSTNAELPMMLTAMLTCVCGHTDDAHPDILH